MPDAIVVGAGPNGLVAANLLADAGWSVEVLEAAASPGGAVRTEELIEPGFYHDVFSAFYPLAVASPVLQAMELERWGVRWVRPEIDVAHVAGDGRVASISRDIEATAASLDSWAGGDGEAWRALFGRWAKSHGGIVDGLLSPFPPVRAGTKLLRRYSRRELLQLVRLAILPVRRLAEEEFNGEGAALLLAGNALHADLMPEAAGSGLFGWILCCLAQDVGFPVPVGGAARITDALVRRLEAAGGTVRCNERVTAIDIEAGRAVGVRTASGASARAGRAVLADVPAPALYVDLVDPQHLPPSLLDDLHRFEWDAGTVKVDWTLDSAVPWAAPELHRAGTVHIADSLDELTMWSAQLATGQIPAHPFLLFGQQGVADPTRSPPGTATAWAYTHVPRRVRGDAGARGSSLTGAWTPEECDEMANRIETIVESRAPGFGARIRGRHILTPPAMEAADASLVGGAINGGTAQLHQQLIFRPTVGWGRAETPVPGLFLASSSAHPGGGVHGACGANAARAALAADRRRRFVRAVRFGREAAG
ncbi:MAG: NAD(P)/FAD-dependent oxidoreductase [Acidimicrobiales bacterium]